MTAVNSCFMHDCTTENRQLGLKIKTKHLLTTSQTHNNMNVWRRLVFFILLWRFYLMSSILCLCFGHFMFVFLIIVLLFDFPTWNMNTLIEAPSPRTGHGALLQFFCSCFRKQQRNNEKLQSDLLFLSLLQSLSFRVRSVSVGEQWLQHQSAPSRSVLLFC